MADVIECEGAPRDLGFDQGRACRETLRASFASSGALERWALRAGRGGDAAARLARDLRRHFPQQGEAIEGMARAAGVPPVWLARRLTRPLAAPSPGPAAILVAAPVAVDGALLARAREAGTILRRRRPEAGFRSLELTWPWLPSALAGVNEAGLAGSLCGVDSGVPERGCAAPAALLLLDCLQRFDSLGGAVDWCLGRPGGGRATLLLADARGEAAVIEIDGGERRVRRPATGLALCAGEAIPGAELEAVLRERAPLDVEQVAVAMSGAAVLLDAAGRRLGRSVPGSAPRWLPV